MMTTSFDPTRLVRTRDGRAARIVCTDAKGFGGHEFIIALVTDEYGWEDACSYRQDGRALEGQLTRHDLVNSDTEPTGFGWGEGLLASLPTRSGQASGQAGPVE